MKRIAIVFALSFCLTVPLFGTTKSGTTSVAAAAAVAKQEFRAKLGAATLAVYRGGQVCKYTTEESFWYGVQPMWGCEFKSRPICTATIIKKDGEGNFLGLTAGHCFHQDAVAKNEYFISDGIADKPVLRRIEIKKFENDERYDYAIFVFSSLKDYPTIDLNKKIDGAPEVGTRVVNVNYSFGIVQQILEGKVVSGLFSSSVTNEVRKTLPNRYLVSIGLGPGGSGSAIVDEDKQQIVGMVEAVFPGTQMSTIIIPTGKMLFDFQEDDSAGLLPAVPGPLPPPNPPIPPPETLWQHLLRVFRAWRNR